MFVIRLSYKVPMSEVDKYLAPHREFLDYYYKQGVLLASGPMKPRTGGIIIATGKDKAEIEAIFCKDPFYMAEIADYEFLEFVPVKSSPLLQDIIEKMEGTV